MPVGRAEKPAAAAPNAFASERGRWGHERCRQPARDYVKHLVHRVILVDGQELADLMIKHGVGVRSYRTVEFKRLDEDFFGED